MYPRLLLAMPGDISIVTVVGCFCGKEPNILQWADRTAVHNKELSSPRVSSVKIENRAVGFAYM